MVIFAQHKNTKMKTIFIALLLIFGSVLSAQQSQEFKDIKDYFDSQKQLLKEQFQKEYRSETDSLTKLKIKEDYSIFMQKIDSVRNTAYLGALIRVKNIEDLNREDAKDCFVNNENVEIPKFPNGIDSLREKIAELFYYDGVSTEEKELKTTLSFVVEKDGSISRICAEGETPAFNKQAEIALYLLPEKFEKSGKIDGNAIRYIFKVPIRMTLD